MWTLTVGLAISALTISVLITRFWRGEPYAELGGVSPQWLAEHRGGRYRSEADGRL